MREVHEETGLDVRVGAPVLINEFHDPSRDFHQVDVYFRCQIVKGCIDHSWRDPTGVVTERRFFSRDQIESRAIRYKPDSLAKAAWGSGGGEALLYDALEPIVR